MVMTLALLVYSVAQRSSQSATRQESAGDTIPNQINQPTSRPTLRWVFQLLEGIHQVSLDVDGQVTSVMDGITELRGKILQLFGQRVSQIYYISSA